MDQLGKTLRIFTAIIYGGTAVTAATSGRNWPVVFVGDLFAFNWRSQFNSDLGMHLVLIGVWVAWRERFTPGATCSAPSVSRAAGCSFPYLLWTLRQPQGDPRAVLPGTR